MSGLGRSGEDCRPSALLDLPIAGATCRAIWPAPISLIRLEKDRGEVGRTPDARHLPEIRLSSLLHAVYIPRLFLALPTLCLVDACDIGRDMVN
jgi:hypothetical protein